MHSSGFFLGFLLFLLAFGGFLLGKFFKEDFLCCSVFAYSDNLAFGIGLKVEPGQISACLLFECCRNFNVPFGYGSKGKVQFLVCSGSVGTISIALYLLKI